MRLVVSDEGLEYTVVDNIDRFNLVGNFEDPDVPFQICEMIDATIAYVARDALRHTPKGMFKIGDRVAAYDHKGHRDGKGTIIKSKDKRLKNYVCILLDEDQGWPKGFYAYYRADFVKRLRPKAGRTDNREEPTGSTDGP